MLKKVQNKLTKAIINKFFHKVNYVIALRIGRSPSVLSNIIRLFSIKISLSNVSSSGSGSPDGVKYCTMR